MSYPRINETNKSPYFRNDDHYSRRSETGRKHSREQEGLHQAISSISQETATKSRRWERRESKDEISSVVDQTFAHRKERKYASSSRDRYEREWGLKDNSSKSYNDFIQHLVNEKNLHELGNVLQAMKERNIPFDEANSAGAFDLINEVERSFYKKKLTVYFSLIRSAADEKGAFNVLKQIQANNFCMDSEDYQELMNASLPKEYCQLAQAIFQELKNKEIILNLETCYKFLAILVDKQQISQALEIFTYIETTHAKAIQSPNPQIYNSLVQLLLEQKNLIDAEAVIEKMSEKRIPLDQTNWTLRMQLIHQKKIKQGLASIKCSDDESTAVKVFSDMKHAQKLSIQEDDYHDLFNIILNKNYAEMAFSLFKEMTELNFIPNAEECSQLINLLIEKEQSQQALELFKNDEQIRESLDHATCNQLVRLLLKERNLPEVTFIIKALKEKNIIIDQTNVSSYQTLIKEKEEQLKQQEFNVSFSFIQSTADESKAVTMFEEMLKKDLFINENSFLSLMDLSISKVFDKLTASIFRELESKKITLKESDYKALTQFFIKRKNPDSAFHVVNTMKTRKFDIGQDIYFALFRLFLEIKEPNGAYVILKEIRTRGIKIDKKMYESTAQLFIQKDNYEGAYKVYEKMLEHGLSSAEGICESIDNQILFKGKRESAVTMYEKIMSLFIHKTKDDEAFTVYAKMLSQGLSPAANLWVLLCDQLISQGKKEKVVVMYEHAIQPFIQQNDDVKAYSLYQKMLELELSPPKTLYDSLRDLLLLNGKGDQAVALYKSMQKKGA